MKKLLPLLFIIVSLNAFAQRHAEDPYTSKALSFGPELLVPGKTDFKYGFGASAQVEYPFTDLVSFIGSAGYSRLYYKAAQNPDGLLGAYTVVPVKAGAKFFLDPDLHCDVEAGAAIGTNYDKKKSLAVAFSVGYVVPLTGNRGLDVSIRFDDWGKTRLRSVGLRVAYRIGW